MFDRKSVDYPTDSESFARGLDLDELIDQLQYSSLGSRCTVSTSQQLAAASDNANPSRRSGRSNAYTRESPRAPEPCSVLMAVRHSSGLRGTNEVDRSFWTESLCRH
jgi:hypothetical protein